MADQVLVIGGQGRVGSKIAQDIATHTDATVVITARHSRNSLPSELQGLSIKSLTLDLSDLDSLRQAVSQSQLVIDAAGPFQTQDDRVLACCLEAGVNYLDISDHPQFTRQALSHHVTAEKVGVTAIINTGIFPGISNSLVRQAVETLDQPETIHLSYVVGGSGGAGVTVMRTTFLGLQHPFSAWLEGKWQSVEPYTEREIVEFPAPYGKTGVYWFDMPETFTLAESFPVNTVITKFGSVPDFYNHLTWIVAHKFPRTGLKNPNVIEFLSQVSYRMTQWTDPWSGVGVAIKAVVTGQKQGKPMSACSTMIAENTAIAAGIGAGTLAELILTGKLQKPGVWPVERILPTNLFELMMNNRRVKIQSILNPITR